MGRGKKGTVGLGKGAKNRAVDSEHGIREGGGSLPRTKSYHSK